MLEGFNIIKSTIKNGKFNLNSDILVDIEKSLLENPGKFISGIFILGKFVCYLHDSEEEAVYWIGTGHTFRLWHLIYPVNHETQN